MKPFVFHPEAEQDLDGAATWYEAQRSGVGREFRAAVDVLSRFPYGVIYWPLPNAIYILSFFHSHRDPAHWRKRL